MATEITSIDSKKYFPLKEYGIIRASSYPLDITELFFSLEDAAEYALNNRKSYAGQIIGVKTGTLETDETKGAYDIYIIQGDGTLKKAGDTEYHPENEGLQTIQLGGIPAGTSAEKLKGQTFSELFDKLLFPTYAPKFTEAKAEIELSSYSLVKIGGVLPTYEITYEPAYTQASGGERVLGGAGSVINENIPTDSGTIGKKTWSCEVSFAIGENAIKNSKGADLTENKIATNYTTLISDAKPSTRVVESNGKYVIGSSKLEPSASIEVVYPYYLPDENGKPNIEYLMKSNVGYLDIIYTYNEMSANQKIYVELPETINPSEVKIIHVNTAGTFDEAGEKTIANEGLIKDEKAVTRYFGINKEIEVKYYRYTVTGNPDPEAPWKIVFNQASN